MPSYPNSNSASSARKIHQVRNWKHGTPVKSLKANNALVADVLPKSNSQICRLFAKFTRMLLEYDPVHKSYPLEPTSEERLQLKFLTQEATMSDQRIFVLEPTVLSSLTDNSTRQRSVFLADLRQHGIQRATFDWSMKEGCRWNQAMKILVIKHWRHAKQRGDFGSLPINPAHITHTKLEGILMRWIRGQASAIRSGRNTPEKLRVIENNKKKRQLFKYRRETFERHLGEESLDLIPDADCCSETEWEPEEIQHNKVGLVWRSQQYASLLHSLDRLSYEYKAQVDGIILATRRFDQCRVDQSSTNPNAAVCCGLPQNCYDQVWYNNLNDDKKVKLNCQPPSDSLNSLANKIEQLLVKKT
ncbi:uncharacterized protein MELLADRAFT_66212 [Melampsora larici-populina 98AG31]|uniref:Uncharacterized protein n=1 Tax=Melampsora larici-populina (strain 98AG31 / pathotype 3-4-7) TaxID=747676 RepID=F4RYA0_MELLP|nr:uncharacterized protein MELLADRAFT_66212 [Melampsora larici-populina 98AG31]EGG02642.1 hypothetical protein MELLADRAFT_66212 [Melampsora larici-populina 98AG31]